MGIFDLLWVFIMTVPLQVHTIVIIFNIIYKSTVEPWNIVYNIILKSRFQFEVFCSHEKKYSLSLQPRKIELKFVRSLSSPQEHCHVKSEMFNIQYQYPSCLDIFDHQAQQRTSSLTFSNVFYKIQHLSGHDNFKMVPVTCYATPDSNPKNPTSYFYIKNG